MTHLVDRPRGLLRTEHRPKQKPSATRKNRALHHGDPSHKWNRDEEQASLAAIDGSF